MWDDLDQPMSEQWMPRTPMERFAEAAVGVGLIKAGEAIDPKLIALCRRVVEMAASLTDPCPIHEGPPFSAGDLIRQVLEG